MSYLAYLHNSLVLIPFRVNTLEPFEWPLINSVGKKLLTLFYQHSLDRKEEEEAKAQKPV